MVPNPVPILTLQIYHHLLPRVLRLVRADSLDQGSSFGARNDKFEIEMSSSLPKYKFVKI